MHLWTSDRLPFRQAMAYTQLQIEIVLPVQLTKGNVWLFLPGIAHFELAVDFTYFPAEQQTDGWIQHERFEF